VVRFLKRHQTPIAVLLAIVVPLIVYRANAANVGEANVIDKIVLFATSPLQHLMTWATGKLSDSYYDYVDVVDARRQNSELRRRLYEIERDLDALRNLEVENRHLNTLLDIDKKNPDFRLLVAQVIGAGSSPSSRTLQIDRGSLAGVKRGMAVIAGQGLVGVVQRVGWSTAEVLTIADDKVAVRAVVVRTRARGRVRGRGLFPQFKLKLSEVLRGDDVAKGDRVITSGHDGIFPAGIPIGEVTAVLVETGVQHRVSDVEPYVDFARLEHVSIILDAEEGEEIVTPEPLRPVALREEVLVLPDAGVSADAGVVDSGSKARDAGVRDARTSSVAR
jgi:rod shape-determining protein MreC